MFAKGLSTDREWFAVRWFAYAGAALTVTAAVGAYGIAWIVGAERQAQSAFLPLSGPVVAGRRPTDIDMQATGALGPVPKASTLSPKGEVTTSRRD